MRDLSVIIPARNEEWLKETVEDVLRNSVADTEVIVVLDGKWPMTPLVQHPRVQIVFVPDAIGQRAATNLGVRVSTAHYVCKLDAHCAVAPGWDKVLIEAACEIGDHVTQIPAQKHLHVYNQVCESCGHSWDQATRCGACPQCKSPTRDGDKDLVRKELVWQLRQNRPTSTAWRLDHTLHFQYASNKHQTSDICDVMTSLGACFFVGRQRYWELGGFDEAGGSWGQFGCEWALKNWLSGGRHVVNRKTWFAHFFRVGGIGFPYELSVRQQEAAREYSRAIWFNNAWPQQKYPLRWLVEKFAPLPGWTQEQIDALPETLSASERVTEPAQRAVIATLVTSKCSATKGVVYYSDVRPDPDILAASQRSVEASGLPIVAVTLKPIDWPAARNIVLPLDRGYLSMFKQILAGLEALDTDVVFMAEHDVLYSADHWTFTPPRDDCYFYNLNVWKVDAATGRAITYETKQTSGLCANRRLLIEHYRKRIERVEHEGFSRKMGFEPGSHGRPERVDDVPSDVWRSAVPNVDIRHSTNLTPSRWSQAEFRDQRNCRGWQEADAVPGWGMTRGRFREWLQDILAQRIAA